jgi:hypothetical protein
MTTDIVLYQSQIEWMLRGIPSETLSVNKNGFIERECKLPEILFITSFPPRECGIATYSQDLITALNNQFEDSFSCSICALESETEQHTYDLQPKYILNTDCKNSFVKTALLINNDENIKLVVMQHEFGFFAKKEREFKQLFDNSF